MRERWHRLFREAVQTSWEIFRSLPGLGPGNPAVGVLLEQSLDMRDPELPVIYRDENLFLSLKKLAI